MKNSSFISILILLCLFNHNNSYAGDKKPEGGKRIVGVEVQSKVGVYGGTACYFGEKAMVLQKVGRKTNARGFHEAIYITEDLGGLEALLDKFPISDLAQKKSKRDWGVAGESSIKMTVFFSDGSVLKGIGWKGEEVSKAEGFMIERAWTHMFFVIPEVNPYVEVNFGRSYLDMRIRRKIPRNPKKLNQNDPCELLCSSSFIFPRSPDDCIGEQADEYRIAERVVGVPVGGAHHAGSVEIIGPHDRIRLFVFFADGSRERGRIRPEFFDDVEFVLRRYPIAGNSLHHRMIGDERFHGIVGLVIVALAGDSQKFAPIIDFCITVGVHRAVNNDRWNARPVDFGDFFDVFWIGRFGKTLVVNDHVKLLGPVWIVVKCDLGIGSFSTHVDDVKIDVGERSDARSQRIGLKKIIVAAPSGDDERFNWLAGVEFFLWSSLFVRPRFSCFLL